MRRSCYDCHSNETRLAWFDRIVPVYWFIASDIERGRKHLNFSLLGSKPKANQDSVLFEAVNQIQMGAMPLPAYVKMHPQAAVKPGDLAVLRNYLDLASRQPETSGVQKAGDQYRDWLANRGRPVKVRDSPNGIAFLPGYEDWTVISSTERNDTHTLKVILGNDVAIAAMNRNAINPWPDGTVLARCPGNRLQRKAARSRPASSCRWHS